ncbi:hypothetical protein EV694_1241 [Volucribacter psittacicida]|uniref:HD domain-containing protein n=1 Tax=Volucribacter psittacicida TaxID=203482 RepID=A0A4R1FYB0_9PAST|nr:hypothetical protein [Volucribacter psittacicida]TCJ98814.1 hypothetical protein EV694_1241 [Volucribacter psittacicida]
MNKIALANGQCFDFNDPTSYKLSIGYISQQLSSIRRFNGNGRFSTDHSVAVSKALAQMGYNEEFQLVGLLYDSPQAIIGNICTPLKNQSYIKRYFAQLEQQILKKILADFDIHLSMPLESYIKTIKLAKDYITKLEIIELLQNGRFKSSQEVINSFDYYSSIAVPISVASHYNYSHTINGYSQRFFDLIGGDNGNK